MFERQKQDQPSDSDRQQAVEACRREVRDSGQPDEEVDLAGVPLEVQGRRAVRTTDIREVSR